MVPKESFNFQYMIGRDIGIWNLSQFNIIVVPFLVRKPSYIESLRMKPVSI